MKRTFDFGHGLPPVCRLGLATRGNTQIRTADVRHAVDRGINYLNWCGQNDGMSKAIAEMKRSERERCVIAWQLEASNGKSAQKELEQALDKLKTDWIDIVTFYYVERQSEWNEIAAPGGAYDAMIDARERGHVRLLGLTSHQRKLAVSITSRKSNVLDMLMLRYNAAHRGAEDEVFPVTNQLGMPVVVYTCLRWGALMRRTKNDPKDFVPPPSIEWYRFALANSSVAVALTGPDNREQLDENLSLLDDWRVPTREEMKILIEHGNRVYKTAGDFW